MAFWILYRSLDLWGYSRDESQSLGKSFRSLYSCFLGHHGHWGSLYLGSLEAFWDKDLDIRFSMFPSHKWSEEWELESCLFQRSTANLHGSQAAIFSQLAPTTTLGNILAIIGAVLIVKIFADSPYNGHGVLIPVNKDELKKEKLTLDPTQIGVGMMFAFSIFFFSGSSAMPLFQNPQLCLHDYHRLYPESFQCCPKTFGKLCGHVQPSHYD